MKHLLKIVRSSKLGEDEEEEGDFDWCVCVCVFFVEKTLRIKFNCYVYCPWSFLSFSRLGTKTIMYVYKFIQKQKWSHTYTLVKCATRAMKPDEKEFQWTNEMMNICAYPCNGTKTELIVQPTHNVHNLMCVFFKNDTALVYIMFMFSIFYSNNIVRLPFRSFTFSCLNVYGLRYFVDSQRFSTVFNSSFVSFFVLFSIFVKCPWSGSVPKRGKTWDVWKQKKSTNN